MELLLELVKRHKEGEDVGVYSVCSAHPLVIEAALRQGLKDDSIVLIEATSNQVNQYGGYTGMQPKDFTQLVREIADEVSFPYHRIVFGGDHLGPNCWQSLPAEEAMDRSEKLIQSYIEAGFRKIHLDCSMSCLGDSVPLTDSVVAERAARLCAIAEQTWKSVGGEAPVYVVGTEVPVPGGAQESLDELEVTTESSARQTIEEHFSAFDDFGLSHVWPRVIGLVVQPGVEFDHHKVIHYQQDKSQQLSRFIDTQPTMLFEAHSTDYQPASAYKALVKDHFAILKVGPALTFALREALFALDKLEQEWIGVQQASHLRSTVEQVMREKPEYWANYYQAAGHQQILDCTYSFSDRIRYYWPHPEVQKSLNVLFENLTQNPPPLTLLSQYLPAQLQAVVRGEIDLNPKALVIHKIMEVTEIYSQACVGSLKEEVLCEAI